MTRLDELDVIELEDKAKCLDKNYSPKKFQKDLAQYFKLKARIDRMRESKRMRQQMN